MSRRRSKNKKRERQDVSAMPFDEDLQEMGPDRDGDWMVSDPDDALLEGDYFEDDEMDFPIVGRRRALDDWQ